MSAFSAMVLAIHWIYFEKDSGCYEEERLSKESSGNVPYVEDLKRSRLQPLRRLTIQFFYIGPLMTVLTGFHRIYSPSTSQQEEAYWCLFTWASTRAIHFELTESLTVASFLLTWFLRFAAVEDFRRSCWLTAPNILSLSLLPKKIIRCTEVHQCLTNKQVKWEFIIEESPTVRWVLRKDGEKCKRVFQEVYLTLLFKISEVTYLGGGKWSSA